MGVTIRVGENMGKMTETLFDAILSYGDRYRKDLLYMYYNPKQLLSDWWVALNFFFGRAFYQGRRDDVSEKVYNVAFEILEPKFSGYNKDSEFLTLHKLNWEPLNTELKQKIGKDKIGKARDVKMVLSTLDYISNLPNYNIVAYSVECIKAGEINKHYEELQHSRNKEGIIQVGPKIASFYLRDVVSLFPLESDISYDFQFCLQPVDVWVRKLAIKTGMVSNSATDEQIQEAIILLCQKQDCSPLLFNQGAWYLGHFAFELLIEKLMVGSKTKL